MEGKLRTCQLGFSPRSLSVIAPKLAAHRFVLTSPLLTAQSNLCSFGKVDQITEGLDRLIPHAYCK